MRISMSRQSRHEVVAVFGLNSLAVSERLPNVLPCIAV